MIFGASTTHALRALAYLAAKPDGEASLRRELAREVGVPAPYLAKVLGALARAGVLTAARGVGGGYRLARPADQIALVDVVEPFEGDGVRPGCLLRPGEPCREDGPCSAHAAWAQVKTVYERFLRTTTLADIQGGLVAPARDARAAGPRRTGRTGRSTHPNPKRRPTR